MSLLRVALLCAALVSATLASTGGAVARADEREAPAAIAWARLGPLDPMRITAVASAPDWPADGTILVARSPASDSAIPPDLARTQDGGRTWERLESPAPRTADDRVTIGALRLVRGPAAPDAARGAASTSGGVGCQNLNVIQAARSYVWWRPPSSGDHPARVVRALSPQLQGRGWLGVALRVAPLGPGNDADARGCSSARTR